MSTQEGKIIAKAQQARLKKEWRSPSAQFEWEEREGKAKNHYGCRLYEVQIRLEAVSAEVAIYDTETANNRIQDAQARIH